MCVFAAGYAPAVGVQQQQQQQSSHTQAQAVLGTYSPMASHQRSMVQVNTEHPKILFCVRLETTQPLREAFNSLESACGGKFYPLTNFTSLFFLSLSLQGGVSVSYPQSKVVTAVGGEAGYCCVVPPPSHHSSCHPPSCNNLSAPAWSAQY